MSFTLTSPAFPDQQPIPSVYTADGKDISPPLEWSLPPSGTRSLVLICDDPDAPGGVWAHWIVFNIPPSVRRFYEDFSKDRELPDHTLQGQNSFGNIGYGGPAPPSGTHRYFFKLYALDRTLGLPAGATKQELEDAIYGHILEEAQLIGTYKRKES